MPKPRKTFSHKRSDKDREFEDLLRRASLYQRASALIRTGQKKRSRAA
jgi:hypothetical protein